LNNIYLTYTDSIDENSLEQAAKREIVFPKLVAADQAKVNQIETAPDYLLNLLESLRKSRRVEVRRTETGSKLADSIIIFLV